MREAIRHMKVYGRRDYSLILDVWNELMWKITKKQKYLYRLGVIEDGGEKHGN